MLAVVFGVILHKTPFGRYLYAIGNNENTTFFSGVNVRNIKLLLFSLSGAVSAFTGTLLVARINSIRPNIATGYELEVITVAVLGGISIMGGKGRIIGAIIAMFLIGIVRYGMNIMNVSANVLKVVLGALLIGSILINNLITRKELT